MQTKFKQTLQKQERKREMMGEMLGQIQVRGTCDQKVMLSEVFVVCHPLTCVSNRTRREKQKPSVRAS